MAEPRTLFDKVWDSHVVERLPDGTCILYIDRHLLHEVTSAQAGRDACGRGPQRTVRSALGSRRGSDLENPATSRLSCEVDGQVSGAESSHRA